VDPEAEAECLESLSEANCNQLIYVLADAEQDIFELTGECETEEMLRPASGLGAPCVLPDDCTTGTCPYAEAGCHVCRAFVQIGAPCGIGFDQCEPKTAFCDRTSGTGRCRSLKKIGERCASEEECDDGRCQSDGICGARPNASPCQQTRDCAKTSFCRRAEGGSVCEPRRAKGAPCTDDRSENVCLDAEARCIQGRCRVRPFVVGEGGTCTDFTDCASGLHCRTDTTSNARTCTPQRRAGDRCRPIDFGACPANTRCILGTCKVLGEEGASCVSPFECKEELDCVPASVLAGYGSPGACQRKSELGEACSPYRTCSKGWCDSDRDRGRCVPFRARSEACHADLECASHVCAPIMEGGSSVCAPVCGEGTAPPVNSP
jgi:hypothetical protein